ncbi:MAG TPA: hypothetical protein VM261_31540 [Kofleriaceae bacterium]|nr:hypothetical protein [Kofleriaceae bacterium]
MALTASEVELRELARELAIAGVPYVFVREPDEPWYGAPRSSSSNDTAPTPHAQVARLEERRE